MKKSVIKLLRSCAIYLLALVLINFLASSCKYEEETNSLPSIKFTISKNYPATERTTRSINNRNLKHNDTISLEDSEEEEPDDDVLEAENTENSDKASDKESDKESKDKNDGNDANQESGNSGESGSSESSENAAESGDDGVAETAGNTQTSESAEASTGPLNNENPAASTELSAEITEESKAQNASNSTETEESTRNPLLASPTTKAGEKKSEKTETGREGAANKDDASKDASGAGDFVELPKPVPLPEPGADPLFSLTAAAPVYKEIELFDVSLTLKNLSAGDCSFTLRIDVYLYDGDVKGFLPHALPLEFDTTSYCLKSGAALVSSYDLHSLRPGYYRIIQRVYDQEQNLHNVAFDLKVS